MENVKEIEKKLSLLDKDYFHVFEVLDSNGEISSWKVFYKNMNNSIYYSQYNKPVLDSKYNSLYDIERLIDSFEIAKKQANNNTILEQIQLSMAISEYLSGVAEEIMKVGGIIAFCLLIFNIASFIMLEGIIGAICQVLGVVFLTITLSTLDYIREKTFKGTEKIYNKAEKIVIKNELKYRKGNVYEINRKRKNKKRVYR